VDVSTKQAEEIGRIQDSIKSLYQNTSENTAAMQNNANVSEELSSQSAILKDLVGRFRVGKTS